MTRARNLQVLPKAHLHVHLEGAMRADTLSELCERYGIERPTDTRGLQFDNFAEFNDVYWAAASCIRSPEDLDRLIHEVAEDAAAQGAWWIEPAFDGDRFTLSRTDDTRVFPDARACWEFALESAARAGRTTGVGMAFVSAFDRSQSVERAMARASLTAELVRTSAHMIESGARGDSYPGIVAVGLHGSEPGNPPEPFAPAFAQALRGTGLLSVPHAGEIAPSEGQGPASVMAALDLLRADRIMHGVLAAQDDALVRRLAGSEVCLDVCPSSNVNLKVCTSLQEHPLPMLIAAGVKCDVGSDDPLLFGPDLLEEFELCRSAMGLDDETIAALARNSFTYSGAPQSLRADGLAAIDTWLAEP